MLNGHATFVWTLLNRICDREYTSCSPVTIIGGTDDRAFVDSLPPVNGECPTAPLSPSLQIGPDASGTVVLSSRTSKPSATTTKAHDNSSFVTMRTPTASRRSSGGTAAAGIPATHAASTYRTSSSAPATTSEVRCTASDGQMQYKSRIGNGGWAVPQSLKGYQVCPDGIITYQASLS